MRTALVGGTIGLVLLVCGGCGDGGAAPVGGFCERWCRACALCSGQNIQEGDCLDNGGSICRSLCQQTLESPTEQCRAALDQHAARLDEVIAAPGWLVCKTAVDRDNPFDSGACPELAF